MGRPFSGLDIFESDVVNRFSLRAGVADVLEHLGAARPDVDFIGLDAERLHQGKRIAAGLVRCGETRHRIGQHMPSGKFQPVHRSGGDDQRMRGIEPAGDADHDLFDSR